MSRVSSKPIWILAVAGAVCCAAPLCATPEDERVSEFLADSGLTRLLEVQLFDRITREESTPERLALASRLASLYTQILRDDRAPETDRRRALAQGGVLVGLVPSDHLLTLRLELLAQRFSEHERDAALARVGLLDESSRADSVEVFGELDARLERIAALALAEATRFERLANRARGADARRAAEMLEQTRAVHSRARFLSAWSGYALAVLEGRRAVDAVLARFGWVLGFEGSLPVLSEVDTELYRYDHVARAAVGVAQSLVHNGATSRARIWLRSVLDHDDASSEVHELARARLCEIAAIERDWIACRTLSADIVESGEMGVATARLLVLEALDALRSGDPGRGGREGAREIAVAMLDWLVDQGQIDHVTQLTARSDALELITSPFLRAYAMGLGALDEPGADDEARSHFLEALRAPDRASYAAYARDAALKLALAAMRTDEHELARSTLEREFDGFGGEQRERALWLLILATDASSEMVPPVDRGALEDRLAELVRVYIRENPDSAPAAQLATRYALRGILARSDAERELVIEDAQNPLAIRARRALVMLIDRESALDSRDAYDQIRKHTDWIWTHEPEKSADADDARQRLGVARTVLARSDAVEDPEHAPLFDVLDRTDAAIARHEALSIHEGEFALRRIRLLARSGQIERAARVFAARSKSMNDEIEHAARTILFAHAWDRFGEDRDPGLARIIVESGRAIMSRDAQATDSGLDPRASEIIERVVIAADALVRSGDADDEMTLRLALRLHEQGSPSLRALETIATICERHGRDRIALSNWLRIVSSAPDDEPRWKRARFESLRLLHELDEPRWRTAMTQFSLLYPDGIGEPWDERIRGIGGIGDPAP